MLENIINRVLASFNSFALAKPTWAGFLRFFFAESSEGISAAGAYSKVVAILIPIATLMLVISGIAWIIPGLDDDKKKFAKVTFISVIFGLIFIAVLSLLIRYTGEAYSNSQLLSTKSPVLEKLGGL